MSNSSWLLFAFFVATLVFSLTSPIARRIKRMERKVDAILKKLSIEWPEATVVDEVRSLVRSGQKIAAIKLYRQRTEADLREAKEAVDAIEQGLTERGST